MEWNSDNQVLEYYGDAVIVQRPQTCMVVTTRERAGIELPPRAKTAEGSSQRIIFKDNSENERDILVLTKLNKEKSSSVTSLRDNDDIANAYMAAKVERGTSPMPGFDRDETPQKKSSVKKRLPTPWRLASVQISPQSSMTSESSVIETTASIGLRRKTKISDAMTFRSVSSRSDRETLESRESGEIYLSWIRDSDASGTYLTSPSRQSSREVATFNCLQRQSCDNSFTRKNTINSFQNGTGIVREKTIMATTITSPQTPLRRVKLKPENEGLNRVESDPSNWYNLSHFPCYVLPVQWVEQDNYCVTPESSDDETVSSGSESSRYPSSPISEDNSVDSEIDTAGYTEVFMLTERTPVPVFSTGKQKDLCEGNSKLKTRNATAVKMVVEESKNSSTGVSNQLRLSRENTRVGLETNSEKELTSTTEGTANLSGTEQSGTEDLSCKEERDNSDESAADYVSQGGRSSVLSPSSDSAPPSALKKRGSGSRSGSGKKQKVQFDMDIEVHLVPRDSYDPPAAQRSTDFSKSDYEAQGYEEDGYSEYSADVTGDDDSFLSKEYYQTFEHNSATKSKSQKGPAVPFRLIRRETQTGGSRRGRRDSYDMMQKLMEKQARERSFYAQKMAAIAQQRRQTRHHQRRIPSPPRTPHSSYYHSREYRRHGDDPRLQMRANAMSPEHFIAFYTRQQQLKQYLDQERRLRRQQLLSGNLQSTRKYERETTFYGNEQSASGATNEHDSDCDSSSSADDSFLKVTSLEGDTTLAQPRPYIPPSSSFGGHRKLISQEEQSRISSGYGGSASESELSSHGHKNGDGTTLPAMAPSQMRTIDRPPFTPRQVAEVMRASGLNHGANSRPDDARNMTPRQRLKNFESNKELGGGPGTYARLSMKARKALQQAHIAYTSSLSEMMPAVKSFPEHEGKDQRTKIHEHLGLGNAAASLRHSQETSQPFVRYLHGNTRGKIPETFSRQMQQYRDSLTMGNRIGSASVTSSGNAALLQHPTNRPGTSEAVTVNMLGLSARLPLNVRSAQGQRSHADSSTKLPTPTTKPSNDPFKRITSGNKSPYLKSQLPDEWTKNLQHSLSQSNTPKYKSLFNHETGNTGSQKFRRQNSDLLRSGPPQLRKNPFYYSGSQSADLAKSGAPQKVLA